MREASIRSTEQRAEHPEQVGRLEQMLNEGIDDIDAGRISSREEVRQEIEALFAAHKARQASARRD